MKINPTDIHYEYTKRGYMLYYKGKPIGGAGIAKSAKGCRSNLKLFRESADYEKRRIISGFGRPDMLEAIKKIDAEEETK